MTTIYDAIQAGQPHTHVFAVGIGAYPHLLGGTGAHMVAENMGLGQLTSPPVSARAFAGWILTGHHNDAAPLGSVELLLGEHAPTPFDLPDGTQVTPDPATMINIKAAFDRWYRRCMDHPENVAIFYFCGHGVMIQGDRILLAQDYGENPIRPFENAFNFERLYSGMTRCKAGVQCFFVDACRLVPVDLDLQDAGAALLVPVGERVRYPRDALILSASAPDDSAYARPGQISRFTQALLHGVQGGGSHKQRGQWIVTTPRLGEAVNKMVERLNHQDGGPRQQSTLGGDCWGNVPIFVLRSPPDVPVIVRLDPTSATSDAELSLQSLHDPNCQFSRDPEPADWQINAVPAGVYNLCARFTGNRYGDIDEPLWIVPPIIEETLAVGRIP